jgi:hypothetical protein
LTIIQSLQQRGLIHVRSLAVKACRVETAGLLVGLHNLLQLQCDLVMTNTALQAFGSSVSLEAMGLPTPLESLHIGSQGITSLCPVSHPTRLRKLTLLNMGSLASISPLTQRWPQPCQQPGGP